MADKLFQKLEEHKRKVLDRNMLLQLQAAAIHDEKKWRDKQSKEDFKRFDFTVRACRMEETTLIAQARSMLLVP